LRDYERLIRLEYEIKSPKASATQSVREGSIIFSLASFLCRWRQPRKRSARNPWFGASKEIQERHMTMTASEMGKKSAAARRKKFGGKKNGFAAHMQAVSRARRGKLDKTAIPTSNA
jgi:hypothetical protein